MTNEDLMRWLNSEIGGRNLTWNNYFTDIGDSAEKGIKKYQG